MKIKYLHSWPASVRKAQEIQQALRKKVVTKAKRLKVKKIAGADVAYSPNGQKIFACVLVFTFPEMTLLEKKISWGKCPFPYIPGLLSFREGPILVNCFRKIENEPDLIIFDGQGIAHPKAMGLASHLGVILDKPTIGCAKSRLLGNFKAPAQKKGSYSFLRMERKILGVVLRTRRGVKPIFVSVGHKLSLKQAIDYTLRTTSEFRIPEPTRQAHLEVEKLKREETLVGIS